MRGRRRTSHGGLTRLRLTAAPRSAPRPVAPCASGSRPARGAGRRLRTVPAPPARHATSARPRVRLYLRDRPRRRARAVRLHEGPARGPRPLRRLGRQSERPRRRPRLVASAGPLFFMDRQLDGERADQDRIKAGPSRGSCTASASRRSRRAPTTGPTAADGLAKLATAAGASRDPPASRRAPVAVVRQRDRPRRRRPQGRIRRVRAARSTPSPPGSDVEDAVKRGVEDAKARAPRCSSPSPSVGRGEAKRIADAVPELTAVVVGSARSSGDANTTAPQGERVGDVLIVAGRQPPAERRGARPLRARAGGARARREVRRRDGARAGAASARTSPAASTSCTSRSPHGSATRASAPADVAARGGSELAKLEAQRDALDEKPAARAGAASSATR